jgi:hypothetical protein
MLRPLLLSALLASPTHAQELLQLLEVGPKLQFTLGPLLSLQG